MVATGFNAITYANKLKDAGMATRIADVQAEEMSEFINSTIATKEDLASVENSIRKDMEKMELRIIVRVGTMMVVQAGLILSVIGFIMRHF